MKRVRQQYEDLHWNYKWHFSTRWMGIDKKAVTVLKSELDSDKAISDDNQYMEDDSESQLEAALSSARAAFSSASQLAAARSSANQLEAAPSSASQLAVARSSASQLEAVPGEAALAQLGGQHVLLRERAVYRAVQHIVRLGCMCGWCGRCQVRWRRGR